MDISHYVSALIASEATLIGSARPPSKMGVYMLLQDGEVAYVGQSKSRKGLYDRKTKHVSGDESHAIQRAFMDSHPDRKRRREYIKDNIGMRWIVIDDPEILDLVERELIRRYRPRWNRQFVATKH